MSTVEQSVEIAVPVRTAYDQWLRFEEFPSFMAGIESVRRDDETHLHWHAKVAGTHREWDAEITERLRGERVSWRSTSGLPNAGSVTFEALDRGRTRVTLHQEILTEGLRENIGDALGLIDHRAKGDLMRFRDHLEATPPAAEG